MARQGEFDLRDLPSWKYFGWGLLNGLFLGISLKHQVDISQEGIYSMILEAFKPIFQSANISTGWITLSIILLSLIGLASLVAEIIVIYNKGWMPRIIAVCGFLSFLLIILGVDTFGAFLLVGGALLVYFFPDD